jgi:hypothetical protein
MTPAMLEKAVYAGSRSSSFSQAAEDIQKLAEANISSQRIRRATERIGNERAAQSARAQADYDAMHLPARRLAPEGSKVPEVACVQMDGGRMQIRERGSSQDKLEQPDAQDHTSGYWRETKVGCLLHMTSQISSTDPTPELPAIFTDHSKMRQMCSEIKGFSSPDEQGTNADSEQDNRQVGNQELEKHAPQVISRSVVASIKCSSRFGLQLAAAAYQQGFHAALRKAFLCDGQSANWKVWEKWFSHYTPIVDFIHALCYVFAAATAGIGQSKGWELYLQWAQWLWGGDVDLIIQALESEQKEIGVPAKEESTTTRRYNVARALTYLKNQRERMNYPEYRRQGLPITSSHIESTIKQINKRVKGTEKFWDRAAEAILHLTADHTGSSQLLAQFWAQRPASIASTRRYSVAV